MAGDGKQGVIGPGQFVDFGLSLKMPDGEAGDKLTFKALQTYDDGAGRPLDRAEDADQPAPTVTLTAAAGERRRPRRSRASSAPAAPNARRRGATAADEGSDGLAIAALIVGALALIAALAALVVNRRSRVHA